MKTKKRLLTSKLIQHALSAPVRFLKNGNEVHTAKGGMESVAAVRRCKPELVLVDSLMPKMDGHNACAERNRI